MGRIGRYLSLTLFLAFVLSVNPLNSVNSADVQSLDVEKKILSEAVVLMDADTGQVLFEKNMNSKLYPASITKIMTALIALENGNLNDTITMSYDAVFSVGRGTSHIALDENEKLTLEQALYALAIASANDAANGIAEYISGSMEKFSRQMTERAKEAGALNTNFANAHGLPDENHYTTPYDMARIAMAAVNIPKFSEIFSAVSYDMPPTNIQSEARQFNRKNSLIEGEYQYNGVIAEKTGWTPDAGFTYVAIARRSERTLIAVIMRSPDENSRWADATVLFDHGFDEFTKVSFSSQELAKSDYVIEGVDGVKINTVWVPDKDFSCLVPNSFTKEDIDIKYALFTDGMSENIRGKTVLTLKPSVSGAMYSELGEIDTQVYFNADEGDVAAAETQAATDVDTDENAEETESKGKGSVLVTILKIAGAIVITMVLAIVGLYVRRYIIIQRRRKLRARRRQFHGVPPNMTRNDGRCIK